MQPQDHSKADEKIVISLIIFLVLLIVASVTYSIYLFIDTTRVTNAANFHLTKNIVLATKDAQGKLYNDSEKGIVNWLVYEDEKNGFEIKYPNDLVVQQNSDNHLLALKKTINVKSSSAESFSAIIYVSKKNVSDNFNLRQQVVGMGLEWNDGWKQEIIGGKPALRTGEIKDKSGIIKDMVIWQLGSKIITLEIDYLNANSIDNKSLFNKIVSEFSIT